MKMPKLKALKLKLPKPPKAMRHALKDVEKVARHIPPEKVIVHAVGHVAGHLLEQLVTDPPA